MAHLPLNSLIWFESFPQLENLSKQCSMKEERIAQITQAMAMVEEKLGILKVQHGRGILREY